MRLNPRKLRNVEVTEKIDMIGNMKDFANLYQQMMNTPDKSKFFADAFNVNMPQNMNNGYDAIQFFLNNGRFTQDDVNRAMQMCNNPMFKQFIR